MELKDYSSHGQMSSCFVEIREQANHALVLQKRVEQLESTLQQLLDAEGVIRTPHNRRAIKNVLANKESVN